MNRGWLSLWAGLMVATGSPAWAQSEGIEGWGRISLLGGWRWVPNWYFAERAASAQAPFVRPSPGGPVAAASFGYGAMEWVELSVDLFYGSESFELQGHQPFSSVTYGATIGPRLTARSLFFRAVAPHASVQAGPGLSTVTSSSIPASERLLGLLSANGGFTVHVAERWGVTFDVRWVMARFPVEGVGSINVGGVWFSVGVSFFFPPAPKRELDVPGF